ncbi:MAG: KilA-N domain-containing protein, partial [Prevotellaceae bacterium]|nr:KilA-N domain-containing protein [Prevotellaceae bacterium]
MAKINVKNTDLTIIQYNNEDYVCITDLARYKNAEHTDDVIKNWLRNRNTIELLGIWEYLHNPNFKPVEFDGFRKEAGLNSFVMTPKKWIEATNAIGIISKSGRYGGTYAH